MLSFVIKSFMVWILTITNIHVEKPEAVKAYQGSDVVDGKKEKRKLTPIDKDELWKILVESHYNHKREKPKPALVVGAWAHIMLENSHGRRVWNNNVGNVGNLPSRPVSKYYSHFGKAKYRSFENIVAGAEAYWAILYRCPAAVKHFESGMPEAASLSLKRCNYYSSDQENYSRVLTTLYERGTKISSSRKGS